MQESIRMQGNESRKAFITRLAASIEAARAKGNDGIVGLVRLGPNQEFNLAPSSANVTGDALIAELRSTFDRSLASLQDTPENLAAKEKHRQESQERQQAGQANTDRLMTELQGNFSMAQLLEWCADFFDAISSGVGIQYDHEAVSSALREKSNLPLEWDDETKTLNQSWETITPEQRARVCLSYLIYHVLGQYDIPTQRLAGSCREVAKQLS